MGWWAQYKKNGTNTIIGISPDKQFHTATRHNTEHKAWHITDYIKEQLTVLFPDKGWIVLCAEIMHSKTPTIKDTIFIHDLLVWESEMLLNSTFAERQLILDSRLITKNETPTHYICDQSNAFAAELGCSVVPMKGKIWYAKRFEKGFDALFAAITDPKIDEGLVLKNPMGKLRSCRTPTENRSWQVKCRHPHANYAF